jgi:hypothetical protein
VREQFLTGKFFVNSVKPSFFIRKIKELFGIDTRTLAVFRMALGAVVVTDLAIRATNLKSHYSDFGVLPRAVCLAEILQTWEWSFHFVSGQWTVQALLFAVAGVFALGLFFGYKTRWSAFLTWFFLGSLQTRNPMINQGGDILLRLLLFWSLFLPLGEKWSLDAGGKAPPRTVVSAGSVALLAQVLMVYVFSTALKTSPIWRTEGSAVYYALSLDSFVTSCGRSLLEYPRLPTILSWMTLWIEKYGPWAALIPFGPVRLAMVGVFWGLHLGFGWFLKVGLFPEICMAGWLAFIPAWFWERWVRPSEALDRWFERGRARLFSARTVVFKKPPAWRAPAGNVFVSLCLAYALAWNVRTVDFDRHSRRFPTSLNFIGYLLHLDQKWGMFGPHPMLNDGWWVAPGRLRDGREIDVIQGAGPVTWGKPLPGEFPDRGDRWRKYMTNLLDPAFGNPFLAYGRSLCRDWNGRHNGSDQLMTFQIYYIQETTLPDFRPPHPQKIRKWSHTCF